MQNLVYYLVFSVILLGGLVLHYQNAFAKPPPWAPAHGYRAKHQYYYYPARQVYFNPQTKQYFWLQAGAWTVGFQLPNSIQIGGLSPVMLDLDTTRPYTQHSWIKQKYPGN